MFTEYYLRGRESWLAWLGLCVLLFHSIYSAIVKKQLNVWSGDFYNLMQTVDIGSGPSEEDQGLVVSRLWAFVGIVTPMAVAHPICRWIRNVWVLEWRLCLINRYLTLWTRDSITIEGVSQRIQEDTSRFAGKFDTAIGTLLDAVLILLVFIPVLNELGSKTTPPNALACLGDKWLVVVAVCTATMHLGGAWCIGRPLVALEITNQRVEAAFRRDLVLEETTGRSGQAPFTLLVNSLRDNYNSLYRNFYFLNFFLSSFDQMLVLIPYMLVAPLLFADEKDRVKLGVLIQVSNSFDRVFGALTVVAENYAALQDFRSTIHRLVEFERSLIVSSHVQLVPPDIEMSTESTDQKGPVIAPKVKYNKA